MSETRNTSEQRVVLAVRRQAVARRQQRVELQLGVRDRLPYAETYVAQTRGSDRDQQRLDRHQS